jgi:hypothetical protein
MRHPFDLDAAVRTTNTKDLHDDRRPILTPRQIPHFAFADVHHIANSLARIPSRSAAGRGASDAPTTARSWPLR